MKQNLGAWIKWTREALAAGYPEREADAVAAALFGHLTGYSRMEQVLRGQDPMTEHQALSVQSMVARLVRMEPLQYVLGETEFYGYRFMVQPGVLIPRPETEELAGWIAAERTSRTPFRILDVGTGSGCLAISLALLFPQAKVSALDVSATALKVARQNALLHQATVQWIQADFLEDSGLADSFGPYEVIVSNPPYVSRGQQSAMCQNVLEYEPHEALFPQGADVLIFYRSLAAYAQRMLVPGGFLYVEINEDYPDETAGIFREAGLTDVELRRDIREKWRMCKAVRG